MWRNHLATAVRHLAHNRLYAAISIGSLAVGFAVVVLVGVFARHELSYDHFLPDHDRLYFARQTISAPANGGPWISNATRIDVAEYLKSDFPQIEAVTRIQPQPAAIQVGGATYSEPDLAWADPNLLQVLKLPLVAGDRATALTAPDAVVLTQALARKYFGDADPLGRTLVVRSTVNGAVTGELGPGRAYRVTAVLRDLPPETHLKAQIFTLTAPEARDDPPAAFGQEAMTYVRLAPHATSGAINRQLPAFVARHIPPGPLMGSGFALRLAPIAELHLPRVKVNNPGDVNPPGDCTILLTTTGVALLILTTAAVNFVGLTTSRASQRAVEIGVRKSVGAQRGHLIAQFLGEALIQVGIAFLIALALGELLAPLVGRGLGRPLALDYVRDVRFLGALAGLALCVGLAAGAYPSLVLSGFRPVLALKGEMGPTAWSAGARSALVALQFTVLVLLMFVIVTVWRQTRLSLGRALAVSGQQVLVINGRPVCNGAFEERVRAIPGVRSTTCSANVVFANNGAEASARSIDGLPVPIEMGPVEPGFFAFFGLTPLAGREFDARRPADEPLLQGPNADNPPVVLNATAARTLGFPTPQAAVGRSIRWDRLSVTFAEGQFHPKILHNQSSQVLGVVPDYAGTSRGSIKPTIYWPDPELEQTLSVRIDGPAIPAVLRRVEGLWHSAGHFTAPDAEFFDAKMRRAYRDLSVLGEIIGACAVLALLLAGVGLFALASYTTERRTKEFGVRKAMGAGTFDIARLLLWQFSKPVLAASLIALPAGYLIMRWWLNGFADRVSLAPWTFIAVTAAAVAIAWLTVLAHTWRVAQTRPVAALRYE